MAEPEADLSDLLPKVPFEELIRRSSLGLPGQPPVEVGLRQPRFGEASGRPWSNRQMALRRALGGVLYPATKEELREQTRRWLRTYPALWEELQRLPEQVYGGEMDALRALESEPEPGPVDDHSTGGGNPLGSEANQ
ncbi:MAG: DUF2795 domain-containing protein [Candidatus Dormibacteria bacterium]